MPLWCKALRAVCQIGFWRSGMVLYSYSLKTCPYLVCVQFESVPDEANDRMHDLPRIVDDATALGWMESELRNARWSNLDLGFWIQIALVINMQLVA
mmetsp:Transcript_30604/g.49045  ORF Transcript_30604/g.49045 Transcript_30604/m.49045 type:complete len:97 (-) Transcript_30604:198-488(-)